MPSRPRLAAPRASVPTFVLALALVAFLLCPAAAAYAQPEEDPDCPAEYADGVRVDGEMKRWHPVSLTVEGPCTAEAAAPNPFLAYRYTVRFVHEASGETLQVPGYFAADGNAAESGADRGNKWRAHLTPAKTGTWRYTVSFRAGAEVAVSLDASAGRPVAGVDGRTGTFTVGETDKGGRDHRGKGMLRYVGERYLRFDNGERFLKGGADSPENLLGYADFDGTYHARGRGLKTWAPHEKDWRSGDPTWRGGKGKGLIGALNYLAAEGLNAFSFLTMNVAGDGKNVWPWTGPSDVRRYDVSKLAQWDVVFSHADRQGLFLHVKTQETENDRYLDGGRLGTDRKLYYRELVARFGHHHALNWNLGEENTNSTAARRAFASYIRAVDPYDHPIVLHTFPGQTRPVYRPLLGFEGLDGPSIQLSQMDAEAAFEQVTTWVAASKEAGRPWVVSVDEPGNAGNGLQPDDDDNYDAARAVMWATYFAGGDGLEWYFGYHFPNSDLSAEDWRSRDRFWDYQRHALAFMRTLPVETMTAAPGLPSGRDAFAFADGSRLVAVYLAAGDDDEVAVDLPAGTYAVEWFNPRTGERAAGGRLQAAGSGGAELEAPSPAAADWVALLRSDADAPADPSVEVSTAALEFGGVAVGAGATRSVTVSNGGQGDLSVGRVEATGDAFSVGGPGAFRLAPGEAETVEVTFTPSAAREYAAALVVESNDPDAATVEVGLEGEGVSAESDPPDDPPETNPPADDPPVSEEPPAQGTQQPTVRMNSGAREVEDSRGVRWSADAGYTGGYTYSTSRPIAGTAADEPYQTERFGDFAYRIPVEAGSYVVELHFAEIFHGVQTDGGTGSRVFDVVVEGGKEGLDDYDIFARVGALTAVVERLGPVEVTDGTLDIEFVTEVNNAKLSALRVVAVGSSGGEGPGGVPALALEPEALDFGAVEAGTAATRSVAVENSGTAPLIVSRVAVDEAAAFDVSGPAPPFVVEPGAAVDLTVTYAPGEAGADEGRLTVTADAPANASLPGGSPDGESVDGDGEGASGSEGASGTRTATAALTGRGVEGANARAITGFVLVDADADADIRGLAATDTLDLGVLPPRLSVRAVAGEEVRSVRFSFGGAEAYRVENAAPYALGGDVRGDFTPVGGLAQPGTREVRATPYAGGGASGEAGPEAALTLVVRNEGAAEARGAAGPEALRRVGDPALPAEVALLGNAPNPFRGATTFRLRLPAAVAVRLDVYDLLGRHVRSVVDRTMPAGEHRIRWAPARIPSGTYLYRFTAGAEQRTGTMRLVR